MVWGILLLGEERGLGLERIDDSIVLGFRFFIQFAGNLVGFVVVLILWVESRCLCRI